MEILCVVPYYKPAYTYGGPVRSISALCEALAQRAGVTVYTTDADGRGRLAVARRQPVDVEGVSVHYFRRSHLAPGRYYYAPDLLRACEDTMQRYDVAYLCATFTYPFLAAAGAAARRGVPYVVSPRGCYMSAALRLKPLKKQIYLRLFERRHIDAAARIHCTSQLEASELAGWGFRPPVSVVPNSLPLHHPSPVQRGALRSALGIPAQATVALFAGRLHKMKRLDRTIAAFADVAALVPDTHLLIVGPDEDGSGALARLQADRSGVGGRVHLTGALSGAQLAQAYADSDLLILLSRGESFGMVVVEAMAAGLPVIVGAEVGLAEEVGRAGAGLVVTDDDQAAVHWRLLVSSPELRRRMGLAGQRAARECFSPAAVANEMMALFEEVIDGRTRAGA